MDDSKLKRGPNFFELHQKRVFLLMKLAEEAGHRGLDPNPNFEKAVADYDAYPKFRPDDAPSLAIEG